MARSQRTDLEAKVSYSPIEAAIRWSGLYPEEPNILDELASRTGALRDALDRWPRLQYDFDRLLDAIANNELVHRGHQTGANEAALTDDTCKLCIRHVDLKTWMRRYYPDEKPSFLFDEMERQMHPAISVAAVQAILMDREAVRTQLSRCTVSLQSMDSQLKILAEERTALLANAKSVGPRSETTYMNIIGGLLTLLMGLASSGSGNRRPLNSLEAVIDALLTHHAGRPGISERTLWAKLSAAKRQMN